MLSIDLKLTADQYNIRENIYRYGLGLLWEKNPELFIQITEAMQKEILIAIDAGKLTDISSFFDFGDMYYKNRNFEIVEAAKEKFIEADMRMWGKKLSDVQKVEERAGK